MQNKYFIELLEKKMLTADILVMKFAKPADFVFVPGQFVQFRIQTDLSDDLNGFVMRSYSICSTPDKDYLEFCTKLIPGGKASDMFARVAVGGVLEISEPKGVFICSDNPEAKTVFVATGTGIAPIKGMIEDRLNKSVAPVTLLFGLRYEADIFWADRFEELAKMYTNFKFVLTLSQPGSEWQGKKGRVTNYIAENLDVSAKYYICGSLEMVKDARKLLMDNGVNTKSIHFEIY